MNPAVILEATVPEEPPAGSVVLDKANQAWQSFARDDGNHWYRAGELVSLLGHVRNSRTWPELLVGGRVTLLHRAGDKPSSELPAPTGHLYRVREPLEARKWLPNDAGTPSANGVADWLNRNKVEWKTDGVGRACVIIIDDPLLGPYGAHRGDWIVKGVKGAFFTVSADDFDATYMAVSE